MHAPLKLCLFLEICGALHSAPVAGRVVPKATSSSDRFELDLHYNISSNTTLVSAHSDIRDKHLGHDRHGAIEVHPAKRSFIDRFWGTAANALPKRWPGGGRNDRRPTKAEMKWPIHHDGSVVGAKKRDVAPAIEHTSEAKQLSRRIPPLTPDFDFDSLPFKGSPGDLLGGKEKRSAAPEDPATGEAKQVLKRIPGTLPPDFDFDSDPFKGGPGYLLGGEEKRDVAAVGDGDSTANVNVIVQQGGDQCKGPECSGNPAVVVQTMDAMASTSDKTATGSPRSFVTLTTFITALKETTPSPSNTSIASSIASKVVKTILSTVEPKATTPCPSITTSTKTSKVVKTIVDTTTSSSTLCSGSTAIVTMTSLPTHITTAPGTVIVTMTTIPVPSSPSNTVKTILTTLEPSTTTSCASKTSASLTPPTGGYPMKLCEEDNVFGRFGLTKPKWIPDDGSPGNKCPWKGPKPWKPARHGWRRLARSVASIFRRGETIDSVPMEGRSEDAESVPGHGDKLLHFEPELVADEHISRRDILSPRSRPSKCPPGAKFIKLKPHCKTKSNCIDDAKGTCLYPNGTSVHLPNPKHVNFQPVQSADPVSACAAAAAVEQHIVPRETVPDISKDPRCPPGATFTMVNTRCRRCPSSMGLPRCVYENGNIVGTSAGSLDLAKPAQAIVRDSSTSAPSTADQHIDPRERLPTPA
ncbi:hypothetical protein LTR95_006007 [Oleoguttula sp. CCFEE 5521]